jgi:branched-chain amino acid transport system ATP-binding protein
MPMLEVRSLTRRFGGLTAVNDVSFTVEKGEIVSLIGPNGAGKSTCFKLIASFLAPSSGEIWFEGENVTGLSPHMVARKGIVRTFQENAIFKDMTAVEAVVLGHHQACRASLPGMIFRSARARADKRAAEQSADHILALLGMQGVRKERAANLPHGLLRSLGVAVALAAKPKLILLDEPFAGLDPEETRRGVQLVRAIRDEGVTPILVEHDMAAVMSVSERIVVLNFGVKIAEGRPEAIQRNEAVIEAYLGAVDEEMGL